MAIGNPINQKSFGGIIGLGDDLHPPWMGSNFPTWLSFTLGGSNKVCVSKGVQSFILYDYMIKL
jgi:hypothetical protein